MTEQINIPYLLEGEFSLVLGNKFGVTSHERWMLSRWLLSDLALPILEQYQRELNDASLEELFKNACRPIYIPEQEPVDGKGRCFFAAALPIHIHDYGALKQITMYQGLVEYKLNFDAIYYIYEKGQCQV